ncbi:MAG: DUF465 domain-containing protein [Acidobacteria bacterium]|jgi:uncharacterized protein YdcH (DUF465 family)|nr:DUF465 domain-containing protein [Acidobacteriota bacterium]
MEKSLEELKAHLMETDEEYRRLAAEHAQHKKRVEDLESRPYLSEDEKIEEVRLKKLKLRLKDQMAEILNRYRAQPAV